MTMICIIFFLDNKYFSANPDGEKIDLYHMAATMSALLYKTSWKDANISNHNIVDSVFSLSKCQFMREEHIDNLAGWAGDLQKTMNQAEKLLILRDDYTNYDVFKETMTGLLGGNEGESEFSLEDLYADVDAVNLYNMIINGYSIEGAVRVYYYSEYLKRFTIFIDNKDRKSFSKNVSVYTSNDYCDFFHWPLFEQDKCYYVKSQCEAARDAYVDYIFERVYHEEGNN